MDLDNLKKQIIQSSVYDYIQILKLAKRVNKKEKVLGNKQIKVAVIGSCSLQYFVMVLRVFLLKYGIISDIYEGEYDGIHMSVFDKHSDFYKFNPNIVIILSNYRDIHNMPDFFCTDQEIDNFVIEQGKYYQKLWKQISTRIECHILQANFVVPQEREIGNLEANLYYSKRTMYQLINLELIKRRLENVTIIDMEYMAASEGKGEWFDNTAYFSSKLEYSLKYIGVVCDVYAQQISILQGKIRKCLVLDLDNTLWGGVVADEGPEKIQIDPNNPIGEAYRAFQEYVLILKKRGVILAAISKNDLQLAKEPFEINENMILKYDDFSSFIANWDSKASNLERVATELNIGTDSFVFFDDNPAEREIIKMYHPEVLVIEVPENVAEYVTALEKAHPFEWPSLTKEDVMRIDSYKKNYERNKLYTEYENYEDYLYALDMRGSVDCLNEKNIQRFTQLINKSNQFNVRTQRYLEAEIKEMLHNDDYCLLSVTLEDKFSKFGIISCVILKRENTKCFIDTWVMSCRVLKRDVEKLTLKKIFEVAIGWKCDIIIGEYISNSKNSIVSNLFQEMGFTLLENAEPYKKTYLCSTNSIPLNINTIKELK